MKTINYKIRQAVFVCLLLTSWGQIAQAQVAISGSNGADGSAYNNLGAAFTAISAADQTGKTISITLNQTEIVETASAVLTNKGWSSLTIQPSVAGITVSGAVDGALIKLDGASNVTIDGRIGGSGTTKDLTISNTSISVAATQTILMINDATSNKIKHAIVKGTNSATLSGTISITAGLVNGNDNNTIDNCDICDGATMPVCPILLSGTSATITNDGTVISNCNVYNYMNTGTSTVAAGIYTPGSCNTTTVENNRFFWTTPIVPTTAGTYYGMIVRGDLNTVKNNVVGYSNSNGTGLTQIGSATVGVKFIGIQTNGGTSFEGITTVSNNTVAGVEVLSNNGGDANVGVVAAYYTPALAGSYIKYTANVAKDMKLTYAGTRANNVYWNMIGFICMGSNSTFTDNTINNLAVTGTIPAIICYVRGIAARGGSASVLYTTDIIHNTISNLSSGDITSTASNNAYGIQTSTESTVNIDRNNLFNIKSQNSFGTAITYGLNLSQSTSSLSGYTLVKNNMICLGNDDQGGGQIFGICQAAFGSTAAHSSYLNNSIYIGGKVNDGIVTGSTAAFQRASIPGALGIIDLKNNIFSNVRTGGITGLHNAIRLTNSADYSEGYLNCNYNIYQIGSGVNNKMGSVGNGLTPLVYTDYASFTDWKTACTGFDANSSLNNPQYVDPTNLTAPNLHLRTDIGTPAKTAGTDLSEFIGDDIDGDFRPTGKFDIGADTNPAFTIPVFNFGEFSVPADATYYVGNSLEFTVSYTMPVIVSGMPFIPINLNTGGTAKANYVNGSGSTLLKFVYTVAKGESDADGIQLGSAIDLNGGTIKSEGEVNAVLTLPAKNTAAVKIDGDVVPQVLSVKQPIDKTYPNEANIDFKLAFNNYVTVDVTNGTPQIDFTLGSATVNAVYLSGSGTKELLFRYITKTNDVDADGIVVANAIVLNGGTIKDAAANDAVLGFSSLNTSAILVDATPPVVTSIIPSANGIYGATSAIFFTVNFNEPVIVTGTMQVKITFSEGSTTGAGSYVSGSGTNSLLLRATITSSSLAQDFDGIDLTTPFIVPSGSSVRDLAGSNAILDFVVPSTTGILVDYTGIPAAITTVTPPADGKYTAGQNLDFVFEYDNAVTVTGTPEFNINLTGSKNIAKAYYLSGSGTTTLTFRYTVATGDIDLDGIGIPLESSATTIHPMSGSIKNSGSEFIAKSAFTAPLLTGVLVEAPSGVLNSKATNQLRVYSANKTLHIKGDVSTNALLSIYDICGKIVAQQILSVGSECTMNVSSLKGIYIVAITNNGIKLVNKVIIK